MTEKKTPEDLLQSCLARCADSLARCLANADASKEPNSRYFRGNEMDRAIALAQASARLGDALARLKGNTQTIRVRREGVPAKEGSIGQANG